MDVLFILSVMALIMLMHFIYCRTTIRHETITVKDTGIVVVPAGEQGSKSNYMIYTTNGQAIKNTNILWFWKFNSDEIQAKFHSGKTYKIKTYGFRVPFLGIYKHIISAHQIASRTTRHKTSGTTGRNRGNRRR